MSETALTSTQADALSGITDSELDLTYPAIGETPYHTTMYRLLHRLAAAVKAVNHLRVYKDGDLSFGVRAGSASRGSVSYSFSGAAAQSLSDDAGNYIYLTISGSLLSLNINTSGFPDSATTPHVPLARVDVGSESAGGVSGEYSHDDIVDMRSAAIFTVLGS